MRTMIALLAAALLSAGTALANDAADVTARVKEFVDAFNKGDVNATTAICAGETVIIDDFPPHVWSGAGACAKWMSDYDSDAKKNGITDGVVTVTGMRHVDVSGDVAYAVAVSDYVYKLKGKTVKQTQVPFTLVLRKATGGWRITGWAWPKS
jgi:ketosteroid isomerase-like protein